MHFAVLHALQQLKEEEQRNKELIRALTGRKPGKPRIRKTTKKKEKEPKAEKGTKGKKTPKAEKTTTKPPKETPKAETPKPSTSPAGKPPAIPSVGTGVAAAAVGAGLAVSASSVIAKEEGVSTKAYWDPPNQKNLVSIGHGHQITPEEYKQGFIQAGDEQVPIKGERGIDTVLSPDQARKVLQQDLPKYEERASKPFLNATGSSTSLNILS